MKITETFTLSGPRDQVFALLSDVRQVAGCVPGVDNLTQTSDGTWEAELAARLGPIKASFTGQVELIPTPPDRLHATGSGRDRRTSSQVAVAFTAELVEDGPRTTRVDAIADVTIRGRLGQFGTGVIRATATELIRDFVACADQRLQAGTAPASTTGSTGHATTTSPPTSDQDGWATARLVGRIALRTLAQAATWLLTKARASLHARRDRNDGSR